MASTITLLQTSTWAQQFLRLRPLNLGSGNEPAITSANTVRQAILGPPFGWRWNRTITGFFTSPAAQDYTLLKWRASAVVSVGWQLLDSNGNGQKVISGGTTGGSQPTWNPTAGANTTDNTVTWQNQGPVGGSKVVGNGSGDPAAMCFIEHASMQSLTSDSPASAWSPLDIKLGLDLDSTPGPPRTISAEGDDGLGEITFRLQPVPDEIYPVSLTLQQKAPQFTAMANTWAPIPDEFSYIYNWGFLSLMFLYADDPRFQLANQKFVAHLLGASQGLSATQINVFLNSWMAITGQPMWNADKLTQGIQAQGV